MRRLTLLLFALLAGCQSFDETAPRVTPALVARGGGATRGTLIHGREIYGGACTACHNAEPVAKYPLLRWREIVGDMAERAELERADRTALLAYLTAARATPTH